MSSQEHTWAGGFLGRMWLRVEGLGWAGVSLWPSRVFCAVTRPHGGPQGSTPPWSGRPRSAGTA